MSFATACDGVEALIRWNTRVVCSIRPTHSSPRRGFIDRSGMVAEGGVRSGEDAAEHGLSNLHARATLVRRFSSSISSRRSIDPSRHRPAAAALDGDPEASRCRATTTPSRSLRAVKRLGVESRSRLRTGYRRSARSVSSRWIRQDRSVLRARHHRDLGRRRDRHRRHAMAHSLDLDRDREVWRRGRLPSSAAAVVTPIRVYVSHPLTATSARRDQGTRWAAIGVKKRKTGASRSG